MSRRAGRILAAALGVYLALSLARTAAGLLTEVRRNESIRAGLTRSEARITALREQQSMTDREVRWWAMSQGLAAPEDTVFFDGGAWCAGDGGPSQK